VGAGLLKALDWRLRNPEGPVLLNCSLMLAAPAKGRSKLNEDSKHMGHADDDYPAELNDPDLFTYMNRPFSDIIEKLKEAGITVVAAAGNDAYDEANPSRHVRPPVRYPAAFDDVVAVGALARTADPQSTWQVAEYSNMATRRSDPANLPQKDGYLTLGGEKGPEKGVLGIYLDEYPVDPSAPPSAAIHGQGQAGTDGPGREHGHTGHEGQPASQTNVEAGRTSEPAHAHAAGATHQIDTTEYTENTKGWAWWSGTSFAAPIITGLLARWWSRNGPRPNAATRSNTELAGRMAGPIAPDGLPEGIIVATQP
jgi:hypothetical protein